MAPPLRIALSSWHVACQACQAVTQPPWRVAHHNAGRLRGMHTQAMNVCMPTSLQVHTYLLKSVAWVRVRVPVTSHTLCVSTADQPDQQAIGCLCSHSVCNYLKLLVPCVALPSTAICVHRTSATACHWHASCNVPFTRRGVHTNIAAAPNAVCGCVRPCNDPEVGYFHPLPRLIALPTVNTTPPTHSQPQRHQQSPASLRQTKTNNTTMGVITQVLTVVYVVQNMLQAAHTEGCNKGAQLCQVPD